MKGIILAGGHGTRLFPLTQFTSKQLLPVYDKPMIYYPLSTLMLGGVNEIAIISTPRDLPNYEKLLGDGSKWGLEFTYIEQAEPKGLADAFILASDFISKDSVSLILGDNIFFGNGLSEMLSEANENEFEATIFGYHVAEPSRYGVIGFDSEGVVDSLQEKPSEPLSNYVATGLYFLPSDASMIARSVKPSSRGELEILTLLEYYLNASKLKVQRIGRGHAWLDTGTPDSLLTANNFIGTVEQRQGLKVACLEEIAFNNGWIDKNKLKKLADNMSLGPYKNYLNKILKK